MRGSVAPAPLWGWAVTLRAARLSCGASRQPLPKEASSTQGQCPAIPAHPPRSHWPPVPCPCPTLAVFSYPLIYACFI